MSKFARKLIGSVSKRLARWRAKYHFTNDRLKTHEEYWRRELIPWARRRGPLAILEIGSYEGQSACWFLDHLITDPNSRLTCVDAWKQPSGARVYGEPLEEVFNRFEHNCRASGKGNRVRVLQGDSNTLLRSLAGEQFDLIYMDGDPSADGMYADSIAAVGLLRPDGLLLWGAYYSVPTVREGVDRACTELGICLERLGNNASFKPLLAAPAWPPDRKPKIVGLVPARNEGVRIEFCLRVLSLYTDAIIYLDDCSTDDSVARVEKVAAECRVVRILRKSAWVRDEPGDRNRLLEAGREAGGTHFIGVDADEALTSTCLRNQLLRRLTLSLAPGDQLALALILLWRGFEHYRFDSSVWTHNYKSIIFCDDGKSSYSSEFIHTSRAPGNLSGARKVLPGYHYGLLHFQFVNWRNLLVKQAWYRCLERIREPQKAVQAINELYAPSKDESALGLRAAPAEWYAGYPFFDRAAVAATDGWREDQVRDWFVEHGEAFFAPLDVWDVDWQFRPQRPGLTREASSGAGPLVTAIVSTCNAEQFLRGCLEDLESQTLADRLEIIVVNSGSAQNEEAIVREFQLRYRNIVYLRTECETIYAAWNRAIAVARGLYLTNANTDDRHAPEALARMAAVLDRRPEVGLVYANCAVTNSPNSSLRDAPVTGWFRWPPFDPRLLFSVCYVGPQPLWRRCLHQRFGSFDPSFRSAGDYEFWLRICREVQFCHIRETLGLYLNHAASIEHAAPEVSFKEAETARNRHWPAAWGPRPPATGNCFQSADDFKAGLTALPQIITRGPAPLVSVIVPTCDRPDMLQEAVRSILGQTFRDLEIVVVNDAGLDVEAVLERSQHQARIVHVRHETRQDRSAARNTALCLAQGKYIAYLDDDDVFYPDHLASLLEVLRITGRKVAYSDACQAHQAKVDGRYAVIRREPFPSEDFSTTRLLVSNFIPILCVLHERSCLEASGGFDAGLGTHEDWDLWIRMSRHQAFVHLRQITCEFRSREDGSTTTSARKADFLRTTELIHRRYRMYADPFADVLQKQATFVNDLGIRIDQETGAGKPTASAAAPINLAKPSAAQLAWQEAELGVVFHFDPRIFNGDRGYQSLQAACGTPLKDPEAYSRKFNPTRLDADQWVGTAKAMGAKFAILVVKHETGFCLWQSDANPFCLKNIPWREGKADILGDFVGACRRYGLKPGIFTEAKWDLRLGVQNFKVSVQSPVSQGEYHRLVEREVEELCTRYGELFEIWFDGGVPAPAAGAPDVLPIVEKHQPGILFYHNDQRRDVRWGGTESGTVNDPCWATVDLDKINTGTASRKYLAVGDPQGRDWCPAMSDAPLRCANGWHDWIWQAGGEKAVASLERLQEMYYGSVGRNSTLIVGLAPDRDGLIPETDATRCKEFGAWLEATFSGKPLTETSGKGAEILLAVPATLQKPVTHIVLQEDIRNGERVRKYVAEAEADGVWKRVCAGSCIGHKRIVRIPPCVARQFRLHVTISIGDAEISAFSLR